MQQEGPASGADDLPFELIEGTSESGLLLICDHASNFMPDEYRRLGLPEAELERHIAYDIGVAPLTRALADRFNAPAVLTHFSRLLIDPNRGEDDPTLVMRLSDGAVVPGNRQVDAGEIERRLRRFHRPYHAAIEDLLDRFAAEGRVPALLSLHSYTPVWKQTRRPWHAGVLWDRDPRFAMALLEALQAEPGLRIGDNEPYVGWLKNDTMYRHGTSRGLPHVLLEIRNDLIAEPAGVLEWADRLEPIVRTIVADPALARIEHFGSTAEAGGAKREETRDAEHG